MTAKVEKPQTAAAGIVVTDVPHAPIIYFDGAPNFGNNNGIINITLAVARHMSSGGNGVVSDVIAVAHLRCSIQAAIDLQRALNDALLLGAPTQGEPN